MRTRRLVLRSEALTDLSANDLAEVVGAASRDTCDCPDYTYYCIVTKVVCKSLATPLC